MTTAPFQLYAPLDAATEAALRASIARFGVLMDVVTDQHGAVLDGHHRRRIADELGASYGTRVVEVSSPEEAREVARTLNEDRRHLSREQRLPVVAALREEGHSLAAIGRALGVSKSQVKKDVDSGVHQCTPETKTIVGLDGKRYEQKPPAERADDETVSTSGPGKGNRDRSKPYTIASPRQEMRSRAQLRQLVDGLSNIAGMCRGLKDVDLRVAAAGHSDELATTWTKYIDEIIGSLREVKAEIKEAVNEIAS